MFPAGKKKNVYPSKLLNMIHLKMGGVPGILGASGGGFTIIFRDAMLIFGGVYLFEANL